MAVTEISTPSEPIEIIMSSEALIDEIEGVLEPLIKDWDKYVEIIGTGSDAKQLAKACYNLQIPFTIVYKSILDGKSVKTPFSLRDIESIVKISSDNSACVNELNNGNSLIAEWKSKIPFNGQGFRSDAFAVTDIITPTTPILVVLDGELTMEQLHANIDPFMKDPQLWDAFVDNMETGKDAAKLAKACYNLQVPFTIKWSSLLGGDPIYTPFSVSDVQRMVK